MAKDDVVYVAILIGSLGISAASRLVPRGLRASACAVVGAAAAVGSCGWSVLHPATTILLNALALRFVPQRRRCAASFVLTLGHLCATRLFVVLSGPTNAVMLMVTLRLISALCDSQDGTDAPQGAAELLRFACCFHGIFTGPTFSYGAWNRAMRSPEPLPSARALGRTALATLGALVVWRGVAVGLPFQPLHQPEVWRDLPAWRHIVYFYASSWQYRWRFYCAWLVMELSGLLLGVASPSNVELLGCEAATCPSGYVASWNTSVQLWLKAHVYRRLTSRSRIARQIGTFGVSAFWHGVKPGYYLCFLGIFLMISVEQMARTATNAVAPSALRLGGPLGRLRDVVCHLWMMVSFSFWGAAFNMLQWRDTLVLWRSLHYYGVALTLLPVPFCAVALLLFPARARPGQAGHIESKKSS